MSTQTATTNDLRAKRNAMRVGRDVRVTLDSGTVLHATVVEHFGGDVILGVHPDLYSVPMSAVVAVGSKSFR